MTPRGSNGPDIEVKTFSVESAYGGVALVRAESIESLKETLDEAKRNGVLALLDRFDGEPILVRPEHIFLVAQPMMQAVQA